MSIILSIPNDGTGTWSRVYTDGRNYYLQSGDGTTTTLTPAQAAQWITAYAPAYGN